MPAGRGLLNRSAVRALALELAGPGVERVGNGVFLDCEVAVRAAVRRCVAQHRKGSKTLAGAVVLDARGRS